MQMYLRTRTNQSSYQVEHDEIDWQSTAKADRGSSDAVCFQCWHKGNLARNLAFCQYLVNCLNFRFMFLHFQYG